MTDRQDKHNGTPEQSRQAKPSADTSVLPAGAASMEAPTSRQESPLITAIEIENFKGIGAPVRIELRPITLLFGNNSAGKSTILHALCYAHELLNHRNVDAHETELGGDQIDLGGFRQFVHGHRSDRVVRLRFDLNLEDWSVPTPVWDRMSSPRGIEPEVEPEFAFEFEEWLNANNPAKIIRSGWVDLTVMRRQLDERPMLAHYEVGINEALVGRIESDYSSGTRLVFNWAHPLFDSLRANEPAPVHAAVEHVREAPDSKANGWRPHHVALLGDPKSPLPQWDELLYPDDDDLGCNDEVDVGSVGSTSYPRFQALVTGALVGIGHTLRDNLAELRYLGPIRELRPHTYEKRDSQYQGDWSDGEAAWHLLSRQAPSVPSVDGDESDLIKKVNEWLSSTERLDTGYMLRRQSTIELPVDEQPVSMIRLHERLVAEFRNKNDVVDLDQWVQKEATKIAEQYDGEPEEIAERIKTDRSHDSTQNIMLKRIEIARDNYMLLDRIVDTIEALEQGRLPSAIKNLVRAIAAAPQQTELQLETVNGELPVRTSDVGVGVSQILPVVVAALDPDRPGVTAIEQPELHVHPRMQVELGDLFAHGVDQGGIFLIETHSEHLILRLLRRIEETHNGELPDGKPALKPDQVSVAYLEQIDGAVVVTPLRINEEGEFIDRWPRGFFNERSSELF